jgi:hypothetical protein
MRENSYNADVSKSNMHKHFDTKTKQMQIPLSPLYQLTTGLIHPAYPRTVLQYWLLTSTQLNSLAYFYHQSVESEYTYQYPHPIEWENNWPMEVRRRRFAWFIGLRDEYFL